MMYVHIIFNSLFSSFQYIGCYSSLEDQKCTANNTGNESDMIFWRRKCTEISVICQEHSLTGINATYCLNGKNNEIIPIRKVIKRILASEEYY